MRQKFILLISCLFLIIGSANANWVVSDVGTEPSSPIPMCGTLTAKAKYTWVSFNSFINDNHGMRLDIAFPTSSVTVSTGTPTLKLNSVPFTTAIFTQTGQTWECAFPAGTIFPAGAALEFNIAGVDIIDAPAAWLNQPMAFNVSFISNHASEILTDNNLSATFNTTAAPQVMANASATSIVLGQSVTLWGSGAGAMGTYTWDSTIVQDSVAFTPPLGTHVYSVIGVDSFGCADTTSITINVNQANGNWVVADESLSPSSPIPACTTLTVTGSYTWISFNPYFNDNFNATLSYVLPASVDVNSGTPVLKDLSNNVLTGTNFTQTANGYDCTFDPGTSFPPGFKFNFEISGLVITDTPAFTNQQVTHSIGYVTNPIGEDTTDNSATIAFTTLPVPTLALSATPSSTVCIGDTVTLMSGATNYTSLTWNGNLTAGADTILAPATTGMYTVLATDTASGCFATDSVMVTVNSPLQIDSLLSSPSTICYGADATLLSYPGVSVASAYCASNATSTFDTRIDTVSFAGVTTGTPTSAGGQTYTDNTSIVIPVTAGSSYPLFVANGSSGSYYGANLRVYIDYDQNGVFDASEYVYNTSATGINTLAPGTVSIPATAYNGTTRMRVILHESSFSSHPCGTYSYGETEEYTIDISGGTTKPVGFASIAWTPTAGLNTASGDSVIAQGITANTMFTAIGTDVNGCMDTATINVVVTPLPVVTASVATSPICPGDSTILTAMGADTFAWNPGALVGSPVTVSPAATTSYVVTGTDTTTGCSADATVTVVVNIPLVLDSITASVDSICSGDTSLLAANFTQVTTFDAYNFAHTTGATLDPMTTSTTAVGANEDDTYTSGHTIGFNFDYNGTTYTTFGTSSNGFMVLGGAGGSSDLGNGFGTSMSAGNLPMIAPWWDDCHTRNDSITYTTIGTAPNRTLIVDFGLAIRYLSATANTQSQVWLHETTNEIEIVYGPSTALNAPSGSVGLSGTTTTAEMQSVNTSTNTSSSSTASNSLTVFPTAGTKYTFTPPAATTISYAWMPSVDVVSPTMSMTGTNPLTATTNFIVSATDGNTGCISIDSVEVVVNTTPTVAVTANPSSTVCIGDTVTLMSGATNYTSLTWNGNLTAGADTILAPATTGMYTVLATDTASGCFATDSVMVTVNSPLQIDSLLSSPSTICYGADATLLSYPGVSVASAYCASNATSTFDTRIDTVSFAGVTTGTPTSAGGQTYTDNTSIVIPVTAGSSYPLFVANGSSGSYYGANLRVYIDYDQNGVFDASEYVYNTSATGINTLAPGTVSIPATAYNGTTRMRVILHESSFSSHPCGTYSYGETEEYTIDISGGTTKPVGFASIAWTPTAGLNTASGDSVIAQGITANTMFTAIGTDVNGCMDTATINVVVTPLPVVTASVATSPICPGDSTILTAMGADTFAWNPGALVGSPVTVSPAATTSYVVTGTDTTTGCSADATVTVVVNIPLVLDSITASVDSICSGDTSLLAANFTQVTTFDAYNFAHTTGATLDPMTTSTTAVGANEDDTYTSGHTIGFNFDYNGTTYTTFGTSSNGFMVLGGAGGSSDLGNGFGTSMSAGNLPMIAPWWDDCHTRNDSITYTTIGTAPNRTLIVDFGLAIRYLSATANTQSQVWLHETTNEIEIVYGPSTALNAPSGSVGLSGTTTTAEMQSVNTSTNTSSSSTASNSLTVFPTAGTKYTFTPPAATTISYAWMPSVDVVSPTMSMTGTNPLTATTNFIVSATDGNTGCISTDSVEVVVNTTPTVAVTVTPTIGVSNCLGASIDLVAMGALNYVWMPGATIGDTLSVPAFTGSNTYVVTGTDSNGCTDTASVVVTQVTPSGDLTQATIGNGSSSTGTSCDTTMQPNDGSAISYYDPSCNIMAGVQEPSGGVSLGNVTTCVTVDPTVSNHNGQPYVRRWFDIDPATQGSASVTLYFTDDDFIDYNAARGTYDSIATNAGGNTTATICVTQVSGGPLGTGTPTVHGPLTATWDATNMRWDVTFPVTGFSEFYCHTCNLNNLPLAVDYKMFKVTKQATSDLVEWTTATEQNSDLFNVLRSGDGQKFETIGSVNSKAVNGRSTTGLSYSFVDKKPQVGHNYYRLEHVDFDKNTKLSKAIDIIWGADGSVVSIYPNPARDILHIDLTSNGVLQTEIKLLDMSGRVVKSILSQTIKGMNHMTLNLSDIAIGIYGVQIFENNKLTHVSKVRKN